MMKDVINYIVRRKMLKQVVRWTLVFLSSGMVGLLLPRTNPNNTGGSIKWSYVATGVTIVGVSMHGGRSYNRRLVVCFDVQSWCWCHSEQVNDRI